MKNVTPFLLFAALSSVLATQAPAQVSITRIIPEAANEGDLVIIEGINLQNATTVDYTANTGGFAGTWTVSEPVISVTPTRITALVTSSFGFVGPAINPPSNPNGSVAVSTSNGRTSNSLKFFYMKGTFVPPSFTAQQTTTLGTGTTQSTAQGKPVVSFDISQGEPFAGNGNFMMELENAVPGATATLLVGVPGTPPFFMFGDGELVPDLTFPVISIPGIPVDLQGDASRPFPIPAGPFGVSLVNQWAFLDLGLPGGIAVSNGLVYTI